MIIWESIVFKKQTKTEVNLDTIFSDSNFMSAHELQCYVLGWKKAEYSFVCFACCQEYCRFNVYLSDVFIFQNPAPTSTYMCQKQ